MKLKSQSVGLLRSSIQKSFLSILASVFTIIAVALLVKVYSAEQVGVLFILLGVTKFLSTVPAGIGVAIKKRCSEQNSDYFQFWIIGLFSLVLVSLTVILMWMIFLPHASVTVGNFTIKEPYVLSIAFGLLGNGGLGVARKMVDGMSLPTVAQVLTTMLHKGGRLFMSSIVFLEFLDISVIWFFPLFEVGGFVYLLFFCPAIAFYRSNSVVTKEALLPKKVAFQRVASFAKWSIPNSVFTSLYHQLDVIVLAVFVTTALTGKYESSVRLMGIMYAVPFSVANVLEIKISGLYESGLSFMDEFKTALKAVLIPILIFLIVIILFGDTILAIVYSAEYVSAHLLFIGVTVQLLFQGVKRLLEAVFNGSDRPKLITKVTGAVLLINPLFILTFVQHFDALGLIIANTLTEMIAIVYFYYNL